MIKDKALTYEELTKRCERLEDEVNDLTQLNNHLQEELDSYKQGKKSLDCKEESVVEKIKYNLFNINYNLYDMLVISDNGFIYQEWVYTITYKNYSKEKVLDTKSFSIHLTEDRVDIFDNRGHCPNTKICEVWQQVNKDTFKKVWEE